MTPQRRRERSQVTPVVPNPFLLEELLAVLLADAVVPTDDVARRDLAAALPVALPGDGPS